MNIKELIQLAELIEGKNDNKNKVEEKNDCHPMIGKRCIIRTYSAGVHIGDVEYINKDNSHEVKLSNSLRLWKWENGGLSLSAIANNGMKGGRLNFTGDIYLTEAIEYIPVTDKADKTFYKFIEDNED